MNTTPRRSKTANITPLTRALAARVRVLAAERMLTQADLARLTGFNKRQVSLFWRGKQVMTIDEADAIFTALGESFARQYDLARADVAAWASSRGPDAPSSETPAAG